MLSLCPPCIPSQTRQRPLPSSDTTSQKSSDIPFRFFIEETTYYHKTPTNLERTEEQALALARLQSKQALQQNWADFELLARKEDVSVEENALHYRVVYTITADICK